MIRILGEDLDFDSRQAAKMASPFGGGLSRLGTVCGALSGAAMALGYACGPAGAEEKERRNRIYLLIQEVVREFEGAFGSIQCRELIQLNLLDPADRKRFQELNLRERCSGFVARAVKEARRRLPGRSPCLSPSPLPGGEESEGQE